MINTNPLLSAALQQQLKKPLSVQAAAFTFLLFEQKKKKKNENHSNLCQGCSCKIFYN